MRFNKRGIYRSLLLEKSFVNKAKYGAIVNGFYAREYLRIFATVKSSARNFIESKYFDVADENDNKH